MEEKQNNPNSQAVATAKIDSDLQIKLQKTEDYLIEGLDDFPDFSSALSFLTETLIKWANPREWDFSLDGFLFACEERLSDRFWGFGYVYLLPPFAVHPVAVKLMLDTEAKEIKSALIKLGSRSLFLSANYERAAQQIENKFLVDRQHEFDWIFEFEKKGKPEWSIRYIAPEFKG